MKRAWINVGVGVGCVGLLMTLLLSAMLSARESARRSQCKNNLKQWGIALHNYHGLNQSFPPYACGLDQQRLSGRVLLLPFLDQNRILSDTSMVLQAPSHRDPLKVELSDPQEISVFLCPSSDIPSRVDQQPHASYAFNAGDVIDFRGTFYSTGPTNLGVEDFPMAERTRGPFGWRWGARIRDILDGTSNTIAMAERDLGHPKFARDVRGQVASAPAASPADCLSLTLNGQYLSSTKSLNERMGERWASGHPFYSVMLTALPPNGPSCAASAPPSGPSVGGWFTASSRHVNSANTRGCHVLMCDGVVRFVNEDINHETKGTPGLKAIKPQEDASCYGIWGQLGSIAGGDGLVCCY
ncbi:MAG: DUF1559 domain-containing protein [Planctomycetaceae bacterium]|nr:DUF1559 domain-containing protein [Planctomycetaceae bacterium]